MFSRESTNTHVTFRQNLTLQSKRENVFFNNTLTLGAYNSKHIRLKFKKVSIGPTSILSPMFIAPLRNHTMWC